MSKSPKQANDLNNFKSPLDKLNKVKLDLAISNKDQKKVAEAILAKIDAAASILYGDNKDSRYKAIINKTVEVIIKSLPDFFNDKQFKEDVLATVFADVLKDDNVIEKNSFFKKLKKVLDDNNDRLDDIEDKVDKIRKNLKKEIKLIKKNNKQNIFNNNLLPKINNKNALLQKQDIPNFKQTTKTISSNDKNAVNSLNNAVDFFSTSNITANKTNNKNNITNKSNNFFKFLNFLSPGRMVFSILGKIGKTIFKFGKFIFAQTIKFLKITLDVLIKSITFTLKTIINIITAATKFVLKTTKTAAVLSLSTPITQRMLGYIAGIVYYKIIEPIKKYINKKVVGPIKEWLDGKITFSEMLKNIITEIFKDFKKTIIQPINDEISKLYNFIEELIQEHVIFPIKLWLVNGDEKKIYNEEILEEIRTSEYVIQQIEKEIAQTSDKSKLIELKKALVDEKEHLKDLKIHNTKSFYDILVDKFFDTTISVANHTFTIAELFDFITHALVISTVISASRFIASSIDNVKNGAKYVINFAKKHPVLATATLLFTTLGIDYDGKSVEETVEKAIENVSEKIEINFNDKETIKTYDTSNPLKQIEKVKADYEKIFSILDNDKYYKDLNIPNFGKMDLTDLADFYAPPLQFTPTLTPTLTLPSVFNTDTNDNKTSSNKGLNPPDISNIVPTMTHGTEKNGKKIESSTKLEHDQPTISLSSPTPTNTEMAQGTTIVKSFIESFLPLQKIENNNFFKMLKQKIEKNHRNIVNETEKTHNLYADIGNVIKQCFNLIKENQQKQHSNENVEFNNTQVIVNNTIPTSTADIMLETV